MVGGQQSNSFFFVHVILITDNVLHVKLSSSIELKTKQTFSRQNLTWSDFLCEKYKLKKDAVNFQRSSKSVKKSFKMLTKPLLKKNRVKNSTFFAGGV